VRDQEWDSTTTELNSLDLAELVLSLLGLDTVDSEAALGIVDETEVLAGLVDGDDVHETGGVADVGSDLVVDLDEALHHDGLGLTAKSRHSLASSSHFFTAKTRQNALVEGISESVSDEDDEREALAGLVRTSTGFL